jgi:hypothetical protein
MCCVEKINELSFFLLVVLLFFLNQSRISTALQIIHNKVLSKVKNTAGFSYSDIIIMYTNENVSNSIHTSK